MKSGDIGQYDAVFTGDQPMVCGIYSGEFFFIYLIIYSIYLFILKLV